MKTFNEMKRIATDYAKQKYGNSTIIYGPLFRMENNELCLGYIFIEFNDELKNDYRVKRPTMWLLQNLNNGEIIDCFETSVKDFSSNEKLPYDSLYSNDGVSILYDDVNYISRSFHKWHTNIKRELSDVNANNVNPIYDEEVLKISDEIISPKDYVLANTETIFNEMYELLFNKLGNTITEAFNNYQESLFDSIRNEQNLDAIKNYYNFVKYSYPELVDVINAFNNIDGTIDNKYDENLKSIIEHKNKDKKDKFNNMLNDIDSKLKEIDDSYVPPKIDENDIPKTNKNIDIEDLISSIDGKLEELDKENCKMDNINLDEILIKIKKLPIGKVTCVAELIDYSPKKDEDYIDVFEQMEIVRKVETLLKNNNINIEYINDEKGGLPLYSKFQKTNMIDKENNESEIPDNIKDKIYKILSHNTGMNENIKIRKVSDNLYFAFGLPDEKGIDSVVIGLDMSYLCGDSSRGMNNLISEYNSGKRSEEFVLEKDESKEQVLEIDPIPYLEKLKTYSVEELKEEKHRLSNEAFSRIPQTDEEKQRKAMNIEYMKVIDKLLRTPRAQNEVVLSKIKDFIRFKDPREMYHYRQQDLEELSMYDDFKELPPKFKMWVDMAIREIYEDTKLAEMPFDTNNIPHLDINAMVKSIDKAIDMEKNNTHEQLTNSNVEEKANTNSSSMSNEELNNIFTNIDNFLSGSSERIRTPEETKLQEDKAEIRIRIELREKLAKAIRVYSDVEFPHVEIIKNNNQVYIDYPDEIMDLKDYMLNSSYYNKEYNVDIQTIMNKSIPTLTADETFAYMYYILKAENYQKGYIANMINSNVFNMLCGRLFNYTYDLI